MNKGYIFPVVVRLDDEWGRQQRPKAISYHIHFSYGNLYSHKVGWLIVRVLHPRNL